MRHGAMSRRAAPLAYVRFVLLWEVFQRAQHRVGRGLPQAAQAGFPEQFTEGFEHFEIVRAGLPRSDAAQDVVHLDRARAAGNAFAAGFLHAELHEEAGHVHHARGFVHDDQAAGTHDGADARQRVVIHRHIQELLRDAAAGGAAGLRRLESAVRNAASYIEEDLSQGSPHGHVDEARVDDLAGQREHLGSLTAGGPDGREPLAAAFDDGGDVGEGLDIINQGGRAPESRLRGIGRALPWLAALAFDGSDQGGLFATDEGAGADANVDAELETLLQHAASQQVLALGLLDGGLQPLYGQPILAAHVDVALLRADGVAGDGHALQHAVRIAFEDAAIHKRAGIALVGVADDVLDGRGLLGDQLPLKAGGVARAAASAQPALLDLGDGLAWRQIVERLGQRLIAAGGDVVRQFLRVYLAAIGQHDLGLPGEERRLEIDGARRQRLPVDGVGADQRGRVGGRGVAVEVAIGRAEHQRP